MSQEAEDMVRRALEDEAMGYEPSEWTGQAAAIYDRSARRRREVRGAVAMALAVGATAATAVGVALAGSPGTAQAGREVAAPARSHVSAVPARPGARASASPTSGDTLPWPAVRVVPAGKDLNFGHQIWMRLTASESCEDIGPSATRSYSCNSVTDGNQPQGTVSVREGGGASGTLYSPLYIGPGEVSRMTIEINGTTYRATVVKLADHPGYATAYLWLPSAPPSPGAFPAVKITVYDAQGKLLASMVTPGT